MRIYLGEIWLKAKPSKKKWWQFWVINMDGFVHKFTTQVIKADGFSMAMDKMKNFADNYISEAKKDPKMKCLEKLDYDIFVIEQL